VKSIRKPILTDYLSLLLVGSLWGASFICNDIALEYFSPIAIACWRILIATLILWLISLQQNVRVPTDIKTLGLLSAIGMLNSIVPFSLIAWGQQTINSGLAGLLFAASPFMTLFFSHVLTRDDRFQTHRLYGLLIGFSGVALLFVRELVVSGNSVNGMLAILAASCCYALAGVLIRRVGHLHSLVIVLGSLLIVSSVLLPILLIWFPPWQQAASLHSLLALLFLSVGSTALAYVVRARIVRTNGAVFMSTVGYLIPLFALFWAWVFLAETPTTTMLISIVLVFIGLYISQRTPNSSK